MYTDKKILIYVLGNSEGSGAQSYMTNGLLMYGENICAFPHIIGSPSSYMTLHPIPSKFPYMREENIVFFFISAYTNFISFSYYLIQTSLYHTSSNC